MSPSPCSTPHDVTGGEEYEPDARALEEATDIKAVSGSVRLQARHYGLYGSDMTLSNVRNAVKPYR